MVGSNSVSLGTIPSRWAQAGDRGRILPVLVHLSRYRVRRAQRLGATRVDWVCLHGASRLVLAELAMTRFLFLALCLSGCAASVEQQQPSCAGAWKACMENIENKVGYVVADGREVISCTVEAAGVSSTYACSWPEH